MDLSLQVADRCDRCGAQAFVVAIILGVRLLFCGHHFRKHEDAIRRVAVRVNDERERINGKPTI
jgi:hypothetical protein